MTNGVCRFTLSERGGHRDNWQFRGFEFHRHKALEFQLLGYLASGLDLRGLAESWSARGDRAIDPVAGDFALVVWDSERRRLWLARSALSSHPLYFRRTANTLDVGTLAHEVGGPQSSPNVAAMARWYAVLSGTVVESMFEGVRLVAPGTVVSFDEEGSADRRFWDAASIAIAPQSRREASENVRAALEMAIADCTAGFSNVATMLSAGRDSSAVTAVTASQLGKVGRELHSFTTSPGPDPLYRATDELMDEAPQAAEVAARFPNIVHHVVVPRGYRFCAEAEEYARFDSAPLGLPVSLYWWQTTQKSAHQLGCDVILTGGMGNLTISDGGPLYLSDLFSSGNFGAWWRAIKDAASFERSSWLSLMNWSVGGRVPRSAYELVQRLTGRRSESEVAHFLRGPFREMVLTYHHEQDQRPRTSARSWGAEILTAADLADCSSRHRFGLVMRDPTADRRVVEAVLQIAPDLLVSRYDQRPIYGHAFGDLLPETTITSPRRAYQSMDWNFAYDLDDLREGLDRYRENPLIMELLSIERMEAALQAWPTGRLATSEERRHIGLGLLRAYALAAFLHVHFPDGRAG